MNRQNARCFLESSRGVVVEKGAAKDGEEEDGGRKTWGFAVEGHDGRPAAVAVLCAADSNGLMRQLTSCCAEQLAGNRGGMMGWWSFCKAVRDGKFSSWSI